MDLTKLCQSFGICTILNTNFYLDHANVFKVLRGDRQTNTQTNISVGQLTLCTKDTNYPLIFGTKSVRCGFYEHHRFGILCWSQNQLPTPSIVNNRSWTLHLPKYLKLSIRKWIRTFVHSFCVTRSNEKRDLPDSIVQIYQFYTFALCCFAPHVKSRSGNERFGRAKSIPLMPLYFLNIFCSFWLCKVFDARFDRTQYFSTDAAHSTISSSRKTEIRLSEIEKLRTASRCRSPHHLPLLEKSKNINFFKCKVGMKRKHFESLLVISRCKRNW